MASKESDRAYYLRNRARRNAQSREWAARNPERRREIARESNRRRNGYSPRKHRTPDELRAMARERQRRYQATPSARERRVMRQQKRRARQRAAAIGEVHPLIVLERHDGICGICGSDVDPLDFHVDHIRPLARGGAHSYANTQPAHPSCNVRKGVK